MVVNKCGRRYINILISISGNYNTLPGSGVDKFGVFNN
jgi:hypothetical protein